MSDSRYNRPQSYRPDYNRERGDRTGYRDDGFHRRRRVGERSRSPADRYVDRYSGDGRETRHQYRRDEYDYRGRANDAFSHPWGNKAYPEDRRGGGKWKSSRLDHSGEDRSHERSLGEPNNHVILQGLPFLATEHQIQQTLESLQASIENIRLIKDHKTGASRRYAFVKFTSVEHARQFIEANHPYIMVDKVRVNIAYSHSASVEDEDSMVSGSLHSASSGSFLNFNDGSKDGSPYPHNVLLVRGLDPLTTEESLYSAICSYSPEGTLRRVLLIKDRASRISWGFAFLEYYDIQTSVKVLSAIGDPQTFPGGFMIDSRAVAISYANPGCFIPVYSTTEWKFWGDEGVALSYWDDKAYAVEYTGPKSNPEGDQQLTLPKNSSNFSEADDSLPEKHQIKQISNAPEKSRSVEDELTAFYSDMGPVLTSSGKIETKSIFSVSDMMSAASNLNNSIDHLKKQGTTSFPDLVDTENLSERIDISVSSYPAEALLIKSGLQDAPPKSVLQVALLEGVISSSYEPENSNIQQQITEHDSCVLNEQSSDSSLLAIETEIYIE
ncbi:hypothetical protein G9A89_010406 [Geosiphon pyriformis]|nr:hypothetical protein G9A89_010406 [Geosiphon pyriformis]